MSVNNIGGTEPSQDQTQPTSTSEATGRLRSYVITKRPAITENIEKQTNSIATNVLPEKGTTEGPKRQRRYAFAISTKGLGPQARSINTLGPTYVPKETLGKSVQDILKSSNLGELKDPELSEAIKLVRSQTDEGEFNEFISKLPDEKIGEASRKAILFDSKGNMDDKSLKILEFHLDKQIASEKNKGEASGSLLRSNNTATKLLSTYLKQTSSKEIDDLIDSTVKDSLREFPTEIINKTDASYNEKSRLLAYEIASKFFGKFSDNIDSLSKETLDVLKLFSDLRQKNDLTDETFQNTEFSNLFLRYLSPRIMEKSPKQEPDRTKVTQLSAVIQEAANFKKDTKKLNQFPNVEGEAIEKFESLNEQTEKVAAKFRNKISEHQISQ